MTKDEVIRERLEKVVYNLIGYVDEVVDQLKPLVKKDAINISEWDTYSVVNKAYATNDNERIFGDLPQDIIMRLFDTGTLSAKLKQDLDRSISMQLRQAMAQNLLKNI